LWSARWSLLAGTRVRYHERAVAKSFTLQC
jgi:hypothetical protein